MNRLEPFQFDLRTYVPKPARVEQVSLKEGFSFIESPLYLKIILKNPAVLFDKKLYEEKDELVSAISYGLVIGKEVEINCGPVNLKTNYAVGELLSDEFIKQVQNMDGQKLKTKNNVRRIRENTFSLIGRKYNCVTFTKQAEQPNYQIITNLYEPSFHEFDEVESTDDEISTESSNESFFKEIGFGSKYSTAPIVIIDNEDIYGTASQIHDLLTQRGIVQVKRKGLDERAEELGMFLERGFDDNEVVFNLNGQTENHFRNIFIPLVMYYLKGNWTTLVECDLEPCEDDLPHIWDRVREGDIYDMVYEPIFRELCVDVSVERRQLQGLIYEDKNYIVMMPRK